MKKVEEKAPIAQDRESEIPKLNAMPKRSRLQQTLENNSKHSLIIYAVGILLVIGLLVLFGIPALVTFAELTGKRDDVMQSEDKEAVIILAPYFDEERIATNSAQILISGTAEDGDTAKLYKDGKLIDDSRITDEKTFAFKNVELNEGENVFKVKAILGDDESKLSDPLTVSYRKEAPKLSIDYPSDGQGITNKDGDRLQVEGSTDPDMTVTINGSQVIVDDQGKFKQFIPIKGGENVIKAVATDEAGNKTEMERKFTYNP